MWCAVLCCAVICVVSECELDCIKLRTVNGGGGVVYFTTLCVLSCMYRACTLMPLSFVPYWIGFTNHISPSHITITITPHTAHNRWNIRVLRYQCGLCCLRCTAVLQYVHKCCCILCCYVCAAVCVCVSVYVCFWVFILCTPVVFVLSMLYKCCVLLCVRIYIAVCMFARALVPLSKPATPCRVLLSVLLCCWSCRTKPKHTHSIQNTYNKHRTQNKHTKQNTQITPQYNKLHTTSTTTEHNRTHSSSPTLQTEHAERTKI